MLPAIMPMSAWRLRACIPTFPFHLPTARPPVRSAKRSDMRASCGASAWMELRACTQAAGCPPRSTRPAPARTLPCCPIGKRCSMLSPRLRMHSRARPLNRRAMSRSTDRSPPTPERLMRRSSATETGGQLPAGVGHPKGILCSAERSGRQHLDPLSRQHSPIQGARRRLGGD